ncbi:MAG: hydrogenase maturation protease [Nitrospira sp.]|nr:hydrogenase maturation protease [Nitrospira sp.]
MSDDHPGSQRHSLGTEGTGPLDNRIPFEELPSGSPPIRVIGFGNELRGDDAVGLVIARRLRDLVPDRAEVIELEGGGVELLDAMVGVRMVVIVDAVRSGQLPGTIHRVDASVDPIGPAFLPQSSHAVGVVEAIELAKALGVLPATVILYGVEIASTEYGQPLSQPITQVLEEVIGLILRDIEQQPCTNSI